MQKEAFSFHPVWRWKYSKIFVMLRERRYINHLFAFVSKTERADRTVEKRFATCFLPSHIDADSATRRGTFNSLSINLSGIHEVVAGTTAVHSFERTREKAFRRYPRFGRVITRLVKLLRRPRRLLTQLGFA